MFNQREVNMFYNKKIKLAAAATIALATFASSVNLARADCDENTTYSSNASRLHIDDYKSEARPNYYPEYYDDEGQLVFKVRGIWSHAAGKHKKFPEKRNVNSEASYDDLFKNGFGADTSMSIFFMNYFAAEFSLGYIYHDAKKSALKSVLDLHGANQNKSTKAKEIHMVPLTATIQLHVAPFGGIRPYIGGGYSYVYMYSRDNAYKITSDHGPVIQAGIDFILRDDTIITLDVKKYMLEPKIAYKDGFVGAGRGVRGRLKYEPLTVSAGVGFKL